jgi:hypothetical protein
MGWFESLVVPPFVGGQDLLVDGHALLRPRQHGARQDPTIAQPHRSVKCHSLSLLIAGCRAGCMSAASDSSDPGDAVAEFVVSKGPKIRLGETVEIVCLNGTFPLASAFARATRQAGARALIRLQDEEGPSEKDNPQRMDPSVLPSRPGRTVLEWSGLQAGTGPVPPVQARRRFFETMEGLLPGRRITITRPGAEQVGLAVGVEHRGEIDAFYFGHADGSVRNVPVTGDPTVLTPMAA